MQPRFKSVPCLHAPSVTYYRAFGLFGRSANVIAGLAYGVGDFQGIVLGSETTTHRSGLFDSVVRFSVNLVGGPAMSLADMRKWQQKTLLGVSLKVVAPTGQYDPTKLINLGSNRWAFKPEAHNLLLDLVDRAGLEPATS